MDISFQRIQTFAFSFCYPNIKLSDYAFLHFCMRIPHRHNLNFRFCDQLEWAQDQVQLSKCVFYY